LLKRMVIVTGPTSEPLRRLVQESGPGMTKFVVAALRPVMRLVSSYAWSGQENIPATGGVVLAPNHISNFDPLVIAQYLVFAGRWPYFLAKASLFSAPVVGWVVRSAQQIPVYRETPDAHQALAQARSALTAGQVVIVYPEGTVTGDPQGWPMSGKRGAARLALETGCPLVPVGQWGAQSILGMKKIRPPRLVPRPTISVRAGRPVPLDDLREPLSCGDPVQVATDRLMAAITVLVAQLRNQPAPERGES